MYGKVKIYEIKQKSEQITLFYAIIFEHFWTFIAISLRRNVHVCLGFTKTQSPGIGTVLHWQPPDVHIFHTDQSILKSNI